MATMQAGIQLHLPTYKDLSVPDLVDLGKVAKAGGVSQIWITDNLQSRNCFVVLAALASNVSINLGTAVTVQYFRSPVDVADAAAAISEIMAAPELGIGLARGNPHTPSLMRAVKPVSMLRETAQCLSRLLAGDQVTFDEFPTLASYFNFVPEEPFRLNFRPKNPIPLYCGGNGPLGLAIGGECMDGLIFGGEFKAVTGTGRLPALLKIFDDAASNAGKKAALPRVAEIKLSISKDSTAARGFARNNAGRRMLNLYRRGYTLEDVQRLGVEPEQMAILDKAEKEGASPQQLSQLTTDGMIDAIYVAGDPAHCRQRMSEVNATAAEHGFGQLMFSELGPDSNESLRLLCDEIIPTL